MYVGQAVRSARRAAGMTLAELGEQCGYSAAQLSRYERGRTRLTDINLLRALAVILDIPPWHLGLSLADDTPGPAELRDAGILPPVSHRPRPPRSVAGRRAAPGASGWML
jgi:transcriptional regulator with XRE-family HTH domain